jgi:hypothetical protein
MVARVPPFTPVFFKFFRMSVTRFKIGVLVGAVLAYALWGSPAPDDPGGLEVALGLALMLIVGFTGLGYALSFRKAKPSSARAGQLFLYAGLTFPVVSMVINDHASVYAFRDFAAFLFMLLPLFLWPLFIRDARASNMVLYSVLALGLVFAVRTRIDLAFVGQGDALYYLCNMPSVLFAAIYFAGKGIERFTGQSCRFCIARIALFFVLSWVCVLPMIETQQRASLGAFVMSMVIIMGVQFISAPKRSLFIVLAVMGAVVVFRNDLLPIVEPLVLKTALVGDNMRVQEWQAVWAEISGNPLSIMFGQGWGGRFASPAVADITVNFTHGLITSLLLKMGVFGCVLGLVYIFALLWTGVKRLKTQPTLVLAVTAPVLIDVFLYASFKSLDFGLVLALIPALLYSKENNNTHSDLT